MTAMVLIAAVLCGSLPAYAGKPPDPAAMKAKVQARGVGQGVRITLADNTEVKGLIVSIEDASFAVKAKHADQPQTIQFAQVMGVHNDKIGTGTKVILIVAIAGAAIGIAAAILLHKVDNSLKGVTI
jgi:hypothetical protein